MTFPYPLLIGFALDLLLGDPLWLPHPVIAIGKLIGALEKLLRRIFPQTPQGELWGGGVLALTVAVLSFFTPFVLLHLLAMLHPFAGFLAECAMCCQILALRCLEQESRAVWQKAKDGDLRAARKQVSRIVGRDTERLSMEGVIRAAVETVAENTSDGVIAPMMFLLIGGAPLGFLYKAINTMDSMLGYKNDRYLYFGRAAARLDDAANFIPARITGLLMTLAAFITGLDGKNAWRIFLRDRGNHASPNAGQSESACAGALGIRLLGDASYFGQVVEKPTVGDDTRSPEPKDILRANRLLFASSCLCLLIGCCLFFLLEVIG